MPSIGQNSTSSVACWTTTQAYTYSPNKYSLGHVWIVVVEASTTHGWPVTCVSVRILADTSQAQCHNIHYSDVSHNFHTPDLAKATWH